MTSVHYVGVPGGVKAEVAAAIRKYRKALPPWLARLQVEYASKAEGDDVRGAIAAVRVMEEYRHATMTIYGERWHGTLESERDRIIVHELMHTYGTRLADVANELLGPIEEDDVVGRAMEETLRRAVESQTEDLAQMVVRLVG